MCGRFYFDVDEVVNSELVQYDDHHLLKDAISKEYYPSEKLYVLCNQNKITLKQMKWGIRLNKQLLINARSENLSLKPFFKLFMDQACLIPCSGFYEWKDKTKYYFRKDQLFYLIGIYNQNEEVVILTAQAKTKVKQIHHRQPLTLTKDQVEAFFNKQYLIKVDDDFQIEVS